MNRAPGSVGRRILLLFVGCALLPAAVLAALANHRLVTELEATARLRLERESRLVAQTLLTRLLAASADLERTALPLAAAGPSHRLAAAVLMTPSGVAQPLTGTPFEPPALDVAARERLAAGRPLLVVSRTAPVPAVLLAVSADGGAGVLWGDVGHAFLFGESADDHGLCVLDAAMEPVHCPVRPPRGALADLQAAGASATTWAVGGRDYLSASSETFLRYEFGAEAWRVLLSEPADAALRPARESRRLLAILLALTAAVAFALGSMQVRRTLAPLDELRRATERVAEGRLGEPVRIEGDDEFAHLGRAFDRMTLALRQEFAVRNAVGEMEHAAQLTLAADPPAQVAAARGSQLLGASHAGVLVISGGQPPRWQLVARAGVPAAAAASPPSAAETALLLGLPVDGQFVEGAGAIEALPECARALLPPDGNALLMPLQHRGQPVGLLLFGFPAGQVPDPTQRKVARQLAGQLSLAVSNARLVGDLERLSDGSMLALARAVDASSRWTAGHSERVSLVAEAIGRSLGLDDAQCALLHRGGLLHDIGKIGIPTAVLDKPGRLEADELALVRRHPAIGEQILSPIESFGALLPIVRHHHEMLDGSGYPDGLRGDAIPLLVRIMTVADVFDALVSERPYRAAWTFERGAEVLRDDAGRKLDADVLDAFGEALAARSELLLRAYPDRVAEFTAASRTLQGAFQAR